MVASSNSFYYQSKGWNITARVLRVGVFDAWPKSIEVGKISRLSMERET